MASSLYHFNHPFQTLEYKTASFIKFMISDINIQLKNKEHPI